MGSIDIIKSLSTVPSRAVNLCNIDLFLGTQRLEPGAAGCKARKLSIVLCTSPVLSLRVGPGHETKLTEPIG